MTRAESLSLGETRRIVLAAQGFGRPRGTEAASRGHLRRLIERLGVVQIDSVNVLARAHFLPAFSRLGAYRTEDVAALAYGGRRRALFEYWGHEASLLPVALQPLLRWRMARAAAGRGIYPAIARFGRERRALIEDVRREIAARGPLSAGELSHEHKGEGGWWGWSEGKSALEWLFWAGEVTVATRRGTFERVYDLAERVQPQAVVDTPTPPEADAHRELLRIAARSLGVGAAGCLRDYFRLDDRDCKPRIAELVEAGELVPVRVEGWDAPAYRHVQAILPRRMEAQALVVPFDPLIWHRGRTETLFGARIRIELYTPREKRSFGYYVLPFVLGDRLAARVDLKADRAASALRVEAAHLEPAAAGGGVAAGDVAAPLAAELRRMADWLGLAHVRVQRRGDLARYLAHTVRA